MKKIDIQQWFLKSKQMHNVNIALQQPKKKKSTGVKANQHNWDNT